MRTSLFIFCILHFLLIWRRQGGFIHENRLFSVCLLNQATVVKLLPVLLVENVFVTVLDVYRVAYLPAFGLRWNFPATVFRIVLDSSPPDEFCAREPDLRRLAELQLLLRQDILRVGPVEELPLCNLKSTTSV